MTEAAKHETVLDTGAEQLGKTYARALIGAAKNAGVVDEVIEQLSRLVDEYLGGSPQLRAAFASPRIGQDEKSSRHRSGLWRRVSSDPDQVPESDGGSRSTWLCRRRSQRGRGNSRRNDGAGCGFGANRSAA